MTDSALPGEYRCSSRQRTAEPAPSRPGHWRVDGTEMNQEDDESDGAGRRLPWAVKKFTIQYATRRIPAARAPARRLDGRLSGRGVQAARNASRGAGGHRSPAS